MNTEFHSTQFQTPTSTKRLSRDIMRVSEHQLGTKFRSKKDLYTYMSEILRKYLPPFDSITKDFFKQLFKNEKKVFDMEEVKFIKVPRQDELSVKQIMQYPIEDEEIKKYLPERGSQSKSLDRTYFFNILNTLQPDYVRSLIDHAQSLRNKPEDNEEKKDFILISDEWYSQLMSQPFISKKRGRTIQLLKESTKILKGRRQKTKQEQPMSLKRFKGIQMTDRVSQSMRTEDDDIIITHGGDLGEQQLMTPNPRSQQFVI